LQGRAGGVIIVLGSAINRGHARRGNAGATAVFGSMKMPMSRFAAMAVVVAAAGVGGWYFLGPRAVRSDAAAPAPVVQIPVTAAAASARDMPVFDQGLGTVQTINTVNIKSRVDGQIMQVLFTQGQEVKQGDKLFLIDPRPYQATLDLAVANQQKDQAQLVGAQRDLARYAKLVGPGFQTRQSFEDQQATVAQLQAAVQADQASIEQARLNLQYTSIAAPFSGRTGAWLVDVGNYVQASAGTSLVSITQMKPIDVSFTLPANQLDAIRHNQASGQLTVEAHATQGDRLLATGKLHFIDNHIDDSTGTIALKGEFANADETLWPGEFVDVRLILSVRRDAIVVPTPTVMAGPTGDYIYVIGKDGTAQRRTVQVASRQDGLAVITKGLNAGEQVVVGGQYRLGNNVKVRIEADTASQAAKPAG
jgi:multidrug efflux system membrane fusion protein